MNPDNEQGVTGLRKVEQELPEANHLFETIFEHMRMMPAVLLRKVREILDKE